MSFLYPKKQRQAYGWKSRNFLGGIIYYVILLMLGETCLLLLTI